jgi:hypothetical protein
MIIWDPAESAINPETSVQEVADFAEFLHQKQRGKPTAQ